MLTGFNTSDLKNINNIKISSCFETIKQIYIKTNPEQTLCIEKNYFTKVIELCYFIIRTYVLEQGPKGVIAQFNNCKIKKIFKKKQNNRFCHLCLCVLICEWENNNDNLNTIIYSAIKMYLREISLYKYNQNDVISFINCISSYLCNFNHFITNKKNYKLLKENVDLMIYYYSKTKVSSPIIFYVNLLLDYFRLNGNVALFENKVNNFLEQSGLISLIDFASEYNIIQECKINLLLNILYTNRPSKELLILHPLTKFIYCFSNINTKAEDQLLKEMNYLGNQLEIIKQINTNENKVNMSEDLLNETFFFKGTNNLTINSNFIKEIKFPCCILFTIKINVSNTINQQNNYFYFKLSKNNNSQQFLKFSFIKEEDSRFIKLRLESPIDKKELTTQIVINKNNYVFFEINKEKNNLLVSLFTSCKIQNKKNLTNVTIISLKVFDFNQIEIGTKKNDSFSECEIGKFILVNVLKNHKKEQSNYFKYLKASFNSVFISNPTEEIYMNNVNTESHSENESTFAQLFDVICYISPNAVLQKNLINESKKNFYCSFPCEYKNISKICDLFSYQISNEISPNFHPINYQSIFNFIFENEGFAYLDTHCEYYYQFFIQNQKRHEIVQNLLPTIINNLENILTILNSLIFCGDKYQNNQLYYEQQILKLINQIIPVIYEVAVFKVVPEEQSKGIPYKIFVQLSCFLKLMNSQISETPLIIKIVNDLVQFLFEPQLYTSNNDQNELTEIIHNLIIFNRSYCMQINPSLQLSMLLGVKGIVNNINEENLIYYADNLLKLIKNETNLKNPKIIEGVINQLSTLKGKAANAILYLILSDLYNYFQIFEKVDDIKIILKALENHFKNLFPPDKPVLSQQFKLYQLLLIIICEFYEKLFLQPNDGQEKELTLYQEFQVFLTDCCVPSLFTVNALIYCCCDRNENVSKFSLLLFQIEKKQFNLKYKNVKQERKKNIFFNYVYFILTTISNFLQLPSNLERKSIVYSRKEIYNHVVFFLENIDFEMNLSDELRDENDFIYCIYNLNEVYSNLFYFDISYGTDFNNIVKHIETLFIFALRQKLDDIFVYNLMNFLYKRNFTNKNNLIHAIGKMVLRNITNQNKIFDNYFQLHFGNLISILNYITIHHKEGKNLFSNKSELSILDEIYQLIDKNKLFSCPILFKFHFNNKGKIILEIFMELIIFLLNSLKNEELISHVQQLFHIPNINFTLNSFEKISSTTSIPSKNYKLPTTTILNRNIIQYITIKYILFENYIGPKNKLLIKYIDLIIDQCLQILSKVNNFGDEFKSTDCSLYNISGIIKSESHSKLLDKIKQNVIEQIGDFPKDYVFQLSISNINNDKYLKFNQKTKSDEKAYGHRALTIFNETFGDGPTKKTTYHKFHEYKYKHTFDDENIIILNFKNEIFLGKFGFIFKSYYFFNEDFIKLKKYYLYKYRGNGFIDKGNTFPSKIKNYSQLYYPKLFIKQDFFFFNNPLISISHPFLRNEDKIRNQIYLKRKKKDFIKKLPNSKSFLCELVNITKSIFGRLTLSEHYIIFEQSKNMKDSFSKNSNYTDSNKYLLYNIDFVSDKQYTKLKHIIIFHTQIKEIIVKRYLLIEQAIEIFLHNGKSYFLNFLHSSFLVEFIKNFKTKNSINIINKSSKKFHENMHELPEKWGKGNITNFDYLLMLNYFSTRTFNDVNQYPIFPWLSLMNDEGLLNRDFRYPITCQNKTSKENALNHYNSTLSEVDGFQNHFGTHYSTSSYIFFYLVRVIPHLFHIINLQNNALDNPNRMFSRFLETQKIIKQGLDNRELIPELFCSVDFLLNLNYAFLGRRTDKKIINDFCCSFEGSQDVSNVVKIIIWHRNALESTDVRNNIEKWIDWVFGANQLPNNNKDRKEKCCVFTKTSYSQVTNLEKMYREYLAKQNDEPNEFNYEEFKNNVVLVFNFGVVPMQLFSNPHPKSVLINEKINSKQNANCTIEKGIFFSQIYIYNDIKYLITCHKVEQKNFLHHISIYTVKLDKLKLNFITQIYFRNIHPTQIKSKFIFQPIDKTSFIIAHVLDCSNSISLFSLQLNKKMTNKQYIFNNKLTSIASLFYNDKILLFVGMQTGKLLLYSVDLTLSIKLENSIIAHTNSVDFISAQKSFALLLTASNEENEIYVRKIHDFELITIITLDQNYIINDIKLSGNNLYYILCEHINHTRYTVFGYTLNGIFFSQTKHNNDQIISMNITSNGKVIIVLENGLKLYHGAMLNGVFKHEKISERKTNIIVSNDGFYNQCKVYVLENQGKFYLYELSDGFKKSLNENKHYNSS